MACMLALRRGFSKMSQSWTPTLSLTSIPSPAVSHMFSLMTPVTARMTRTCVRGAMQAWNGSPTSASSQAKQADALCGIPCSNLASRARAPPGRSPWYTRKSFVVQSSTEDRDCGEVFVADGTLVLCSCIIGLVSSSVSGSRGIPRPSISLLKLPNKAAAATIYSIAPFDMTPSSSRASSTVRELGTVPSPYATLVTACCEGVNTLLSLSSSACNTVGSTPRRAAKEQQWLVQ
mmetsp:Transcript_22143/g.23699  ORF Transcript_22143/g.23699 Transcript_22143/m.23699 type:complete len:233 (+) Transcript_22143:634-1332(+)